MNKSEQAPPDMKTVIQILEKEIRDKVYLREEFKQKN